MNKIYSRKKINLPKIKNKFKCDNKKLKKFIKIIFILIISLYIAGTIWKAISPVFDALCQEEAKSIATIISNKQATDVMKLYNYEDLFNIEKDNNGNITMIEANVIPINEITSSIAINIQENINEEGKKSIGIPLGTFTGIKFLAGRGPNINFTISSVGNVETNLESEFVEQGINQTLHRVHLQVACKIKILTPFSNTEETINNQILLLENVIIGQIPSTYYNLEGMTESEAIDIIE